MLILDLFKDQRGILLVIFVAWMKKLLLKDLQFGFRDIRESQIEHFESLFVGLYRPRLSEQVHYKVLKMRGEGFAQV